MPEVAEIIDTSRVNRPVWFGRSVEADVLVAKAMELLDRIPLNGCPFCGACQPDVECSEHIDPRSETGKERVTGYGVFCGRCFGRGPEHWVNAQTVLDYDSAAWCRLNAIFDWNTGRKVPMMLHPEYKEICRLLMDADMSYLKELGTKEKPDEDRG